METSNPLSEDELRKIDAYWRACNYLAVGMIYLRENPLLKESLKPSDVKHRLLGHWGSSPGLSFIYIHLNRLIKKYDLDMIYLAGPGHGAPGVLAPVYLEGTYSEIYPNISEDAEGMQKFFKQFSFPGGIGSHCTPETPGSIHEGGELGYSLSHAYGSVFDNPDLISVCVVGDGEAETGALATAWHSNKFLNPIRDGAVLPVLHLNGYKIANPTILSRISHEELEALFKGYGYKPYFVEGCDPALMHQKMADILETAISEIKAIQAEARSTGIAKRPLSASPHANEGVLRKDLRLQDFRDYGVPVEYPGKSEVENTNPLGKFLRDVMRNNLQNFRVFGPDETASNRLNAIYEVSKKTWMGDFLPEDLDGSELATDGRVMEILSEHTLEGWLEGYLLTGRHGFFHTYEAFAHVIDSMFNQHAKWLDICRNEVSWRSPISSLNILLSSTVWRQDHNGFSHQDPGFLDVVTNKSASVTRIYLPPDANCLLSVADHCLKSTNYINVIVADKQKHLQFLTMDEAIKHCTKGIGIWEWASSDDCGKDPDIPDVIMAGCGDVATMESLAATAILREEIPDLKVRFVNVVDLFKLQPDTEHPHGLSDRDFDSLFTTDKPIIFNFHGYPWLIHKLAYRRKNHANMHVRGYKEKGNINTPLELAINNQVDRFNLVIDVIDRVPKLGSAAAYVRERMKNAIIENVNYAHEHGIDKDEIVNWKWPF
jgi:phosphoketolase